MNSEVPRSRPRYPYGKARVYLSAVLTVLSVILAFLLFWGRVPFLYYLGLTAVLVVVAIKLKTRFFYAETLESPEEGMLAPEGEMQNWKTLLILACILIVSMLLPLALARFHPEIWLIGITSYVSGVSIAEVLYFLTSRR